MKECLACGKLFSSSGRKFCSRACYAEAYKRGLLVNGGWFKKGQPSLNKGRTLESWVGVERARKIRTRMLENSKGKAEFLRTLNTNVELLRKRVASRKIHEEVVKAIVDELRADGKRCFTLSEYVRERRIPDAILFDGRKLIAIEVEQEKRYKPSAPTVIERLRSLNASANFFDETQVFFVSASKPLKEIVRECLSKLA